MAEIDPEKVGRSGIDPITGSILSQEVRNSLLKKTTFDASVFRNELLAVEGRRRELDLQNTNVIREQESVLIGFNSNIQALRSDIGKLGTGLANIALLLQQDGAEEQSRLRSEQERQRRLAEQQIRIGKENEIEQKIQNALALPVQKLVPQVNDVFGKIGSALAILFGGWLTNQVVQAIKASEEGNTKLFNEIKFNIIKNLAIAGGGLLAIKAGFSLVKNTIAKVASGLTRLLIAKPLALAAGLLRLPGMGGGKPPGTPRGPKSGGGILSGLGKLLTGLSVAMNLKNKEYTDSVLGALSLFAKAPGPVGLVAKVAGVAFTLDEIAEAFGKNIFGDERDKIINDAAVAAKKELEKLKESTSAKPTSSTKPTPSPAPPQPMVQPKTPMMGEQKPSTPPPPSSERVSQFEQAWQYRNNPFARGRIESAWEKMSEEERQQAKEWAKTKGYDWNEMKLKDSSSMMSPAQTTPQSTKEGTAPAQMVMPAQVTAPPKEPVKVGQLPEPKPSLTMIKTSNNVNQQPNVPITNGALSDVPLINSANPDNFYVLYSQLTYNVVT